MPPLRQKVEVRKSQSHTIFQGTWYVLAFGKCFRRYTWRCAIDFAFSIAAQHKQWVQKASKKYSR